MPFMIGFCHKWIPVDAKKRCLSIVDEGDIFLTWSYTNQRRMGIRQSMCLSHSATFWKGPFSKQVPHCSCVSDTYIALSGANVITAIVATCFVSISIGPELFLWRQQLKILFMSLTTCLLNRSPVRKYRKMFNTGLIDAIARKS